MGNFLRGLPGMIDVTDPSHQAECNSVH
jgi:hypothetical protein